MSDAPSLTIGIIGAGNVGTALATMLAQGGHQVYLGVRDTQRKNAQLSAAGWQQPSNCTLISFDEAVSSAPLIILAVPDGEIASLARDVLRRCPTGSIVAHCSGALSSNILKLNTGASISACSLHPLNTFPNLAAALAIANEPDHKTAMVCEGDEEALAITQPLFNQLGFNCMTIEADAKPLYHAASVMVCNYLTVVMEAGLQTAELAGLSKDDFWRAVQPLIAATLNNVGKEQSLSGPIARGDSSTVELHLQQLAKSSPELGTLYSALGRATIELAHAQQQITSDQQRDLLERLTTTKVTLTNDKD